MFIERDERPWGAYEVLAEGEGYKVKRIEVKPGHRLSLQMHQNRSEHWVVVSGEAIVTLGEREIRLKTQNQASGRQSRDDPFALYRSTMRKLSWRG